MSIQNWTLLCVHKLVTQNQLELISWNNYNPMHNNNNDYIVLLYDLAGN